MPNLKTRTLPGAPGPRIIVRGRGDDERGARAAGGRAARSSSADAPMEGMEGAEEGGVRVRSSSVPRDRSMTRRDSASIAQTLTLTLTPTLAPTLTPTLTPSLAPTLAPTLTRSSTRRTRC